MDLEALGRLGADHQLVLRELALEFFPKTPPPNTVEPLDHYLVDDNVVTGGLTAVVAPQTFCGCASVCGQAAEPASQFVANRRVIGGRKRSSGIVIDRKKQLHKVHALSSHRLAHIRDLQLTGRCCEMARRELCGYPA